LRLVRVVWCGGVGWGDVCIEGSVWSCMENSFTGMGRVWEDNIKMNLKDMGVRLFAVFIWLSISFGGGLLLTRL